ncbi:MULTISPECIES: helix-turn-helix domain-containing protein [Chelatococcus]|uniref:Transcriptional regulator with XRE-family HTH domain n=1 Tax=Chelatococcus caeni TaxID=1348468 RepID=A0A840BUC3_9HYPH|nr:MULTISPECIES: helix-turn-helix transcriptional regulator [Chelatococcus]MBB4015108.1 transcriptional regulator with XRE-family HTH domain [Chelatococcus caeni]
MSERKWLLTNAELRMNDIGGRLKAARMQGGYASAAVAARTFGWSEVTYRAHENGTRTVSVSMAKIYADAFGIDIGWLLLGAGSGASSLPDGA